jgi:pimeloyl-ACP methyl ester carboxylesterase
MFDEQAFIAQVEMADTEELLRILDHPTVEEEKALRAHLGDERYQRMHGLALRHNVTRSVGQPTKGNVVVIHGIMGAELNVSSGGDGDLTWVNIFRIVRGWLDRLRLSDDGRTEYNSKFKVRASGIMKRFYGELLLSLAEKWNVRAFWFDWRKDMQLAADNLNTQIDGWFGAHAPVHIIAHSMGGLVARTFMKKYKERWEAMWDKGDATRPAGTSGGRLVMLGTPNYGSFAIPQVATGIEGLVKKLALADLRHSVRELLETFNSFVGSYQMLPSPFVMKPMERLYQSGTYGGYNVPQRHLDNARQYHQFLSDAIDAKRMVYVAGFGQPTFNNIKLDAGGVNFLPLDNVDSYEMTLDGDGRVPHSLGLLKGNGKPVETYFIREEHGKLSSNSQILEALDELLETGKTDDMFADLSQAQAASARGAKDEAHSAEEIKKRWKEEQDADEQRIRISLRRMIGRGININAPSFTRADESVEIDEDDAQGRFSPEQRKVEEAITRGFLASHDGDEAAEESDIERGNEIEDSEIEIGLIYGGIETVHQKIHGAQVSPVDAIAVGHYIGVQPQAAEKKIDEAISRALLGKDQNDSSEVHEADLILTQYTERGIIHGKLGEPFFMPDPRQEKERSAGAAKYTRLIVLAGMGESGRFGVPELTVLARELCWSLGRMDKRHLATVLIGIGIGNLSMQEAITGWLNGIRRAITGSKFDASRRLQRVTFVEIDPRKIEPLQKMLQEECARQEKLGLKVKYKPYSEKQLSALKDDELKWDRADWVKRRASIEQTINVAPTRVTLSLDRSRRTYSFGAITADASVPEREVKIDPEVVMQANDELAGEQNMVMQLERGRFLEELLMPNDLRRQLYSRAPLVMMLDATTARIHWEMVAQPSLSGAAERSSSRSAQDIKFEYADNFLSTSRGLTRQLRTTFAAPPEPPPPPRRVLRVLVVADPAEDGHLPGAQEEGAAVADIFESYNTVFKDKAQESRVEVKRLFGPVDATRTNVLRELMVRTYDVLHFAGHCVYQWGGHPELSGWIFNFARREVLSADELNRIDRVPKFVFSNACESGITPDRSGERNVNLAPSFAEAFFARGVANFLCTAWPVDDVAARVFALTLYAGLLGYDDEAADKPDRRPSRREDGPKRMFEAMRDARLAIARTADGTTTWGAYQHYGNPYFQFFYSAEQAGEEEETKQQSAKRSSKKRGTAKRATAKSRVKK